MKKLEYFLDKFYEISDKIGKHNVVLIAFIVIVVIITGLYSTFSIFTSTDGVDVVDGLRTYKFVLDPTLSVNSIIIPANTEKNLDVVVTNSESTKLKYGLYYSATGEVTVGYTSTSLSEATGIVGANSISIVSLKVINDTSSNVTVTLGLAYGFENGGDLVLPDGSNWITIYVNKPNLDATVYAVNYSLTSDEVSVDNLIPVYYDETATDSDGSVGAWRKADSSNIGNSWYNYEKKMWANAVLISDVEKRAIYQQADVDTLVSVSDISAFLVWIPRFKYRVWNITRQAGDETTYAYPAYTNGIDIMFETKTASTGNVKCTYNTGNVSPDTTLSDTCVYNETDTITPGSDNKNYTDAWYTHPAFTFGGEEKTGFWVGKFETTGTEEAPTVLPDAISLTNQNFAIQFTTAKVFQTYGLSDNMDAHILTKLEQGAVLYLMYSLYGLCDENSCRDAYYNNSSSYYTGRSYGGFWDETVDTTYGTYDYKGYSIDSSTGLSTTTQDKSIIASTTGNITGVYDTNSKISEHWMANMVDSSNQFYESYAKLDGGDWNGKQTLDTKYYNAYSYGTTYNDQAAFNRARLGDGTVEVIGEIGNNFGGWMPGKALTGSSSSMVYYDGENSPYSWGISGDSRSSFGFNYTNGGGSISYTFRLALS